MKFLKLFTISIFCITLLKASVGYIYNESDVKLPLKKEGIILYNGTPVDILTDKNNLFKVKVEGFLKNKTLYATKNYKLKLADIKKSKKMEVLSNNKTKLVLNVPSKYITDDMEEAWSDGSDLFYEKCTKCHHAKIIEKHTMQEWDVLFNSMKPKTKISKEESMQIIRFLRAFSKDGILKESN